MKRLPRRSPSPAPSLAWVAFALLGLGLVGAIFAMFAHRQNQEVGRKMEMTNLRREIDDLRAETSLLQRDLDGRLRKPMLEQGIKEKQLVLVKIGSDYEIPWTPPTPPVSSVAGQ